MQIELSQEEIRYLTDRLQEEAGYLSKMNGEQWADRSLTLCENILDRLLEA